MISYSFYHFTWNVIRGKQENDKQVEKLTRSSDSPPQKSGLLILWQYLMIVRILRRLLSYCRTQEHS